MRVAAISYRSTAGIPEAAEKHRSWADIQPEPLHAEWFAQKRLLA